MEQSQKQICMPPRLASITRQTRLPMVASSARAEDDLLVDHHRSFGTECPPYYTLYNRDGSQAAPAAWGSDGLSLMELRSCGQPLEYASTHSPAADIISRTHGGRFNRQELVAPAAVAASVDTWNGVRDDSHLPSLCTDQQVGCAASQQDMPETTYTIAASQESSEKNSTSSDCGRSHLLQLPPAAAGLPTMPIGDESSPLGTLRDSVGTQSGASGQRSPTSTRAALRSHQLMFQHNSMRQANRVPGADAAHGPVAESAEHLDSRMSVDDSCPPAWVSGSPPQDGTQATGPTPGMQVLTFLLSSWELDSVCPLARATDHLVLSTLAAAGRSSECTRNALSRSAAACGRCLQAQGGR